MRLLYVTNSLAVGGVETNLVGLAHELGRRGHGVTVASAGGVLEGELASHGAHLVRVPISLRDPLGLLLAALRIRALIARERFDVVHAMSAAGNLATLFAPRGHRPVFVTSPMGLQQSDRESVFITDLRNRFLTWRADSVLLISEEIGAALRRLNVAPGRLTVTSVVGIDVPRFEGLAAAGATVRRTLGIAPGGEVVTSIGALHSRKRHDLLVAAAPAVLAERPRTRFLIVGEGPQRSALAEQIATLGLADSVLLVGQRHDIAAILAATDVYVRPGILEGFIGVTVLEAMAARRPVIAWATRDVRAAISHEDTGLLVPIADTQVLARAILRLLTDTGLATALAERGRERVEKRFSLSAVAAELEALYAELLRGR